MTTQDISVGGLVLAYATVVLSLVFAAYLQLGKIKEILVAVLRMSVQLAAVGLYLHFIFEWNHPWVNVGYVLGMVVIANYSLVRNSGLVMGFFFTSLPALVVSLALVIGYFLLFVFQPDPLHDARYLIPIAGMILGNSMSRTIITLERFYRSIQQDFDEHCALIALGGTVREVALPYLRTAYKAGLQPWLANMATMGLVFLPGMMTGQILGGSSPEVAIKYQIAIILAIFAATELASFTTIRFSLTRGFDEFGYLKRDLFREKKQ